MKGLKAHTPVRCRNNNNYYKDTSATMKTVAEILQLDDIICFQVRFIPFPYREYKSRDYLCKKCSTRHM